MLLFYILGILALLITAAAAVYYRIRVLLLRSKLRTALRNSAEIGGFMTLFSRNIRNIRETANWMNVTARYVADAVEAAAVCIYSRGASGRMTLTGTAGYVPRKMRVLEVRAPASLQASGDGTPAQPLSLTDMNMLEIVAETRESILIDNPRDERLQEIDPLGKEVSTFMAVPIVNEGTVLGVLCAINNSRGLGISSFSGEQLSRLKFIAGQVVLADNIVRVYANLSEQQRISQELEFARSLQSSLLPKSVPVWGRFMVQAFTRASKEVSGDFYDFVEIDNDRLLVVIGDACGKGIPACMIMAMTRSFIRANTGRFTTLKEMLLELNDNLYRDMGDGRYITLGVCLLNRKESSLEYARAGHTELLMYVRGHIRSINPDGAGLGLLPGMLAEFDTFSIELSQGMEMLLFTDGINEATDPKGEYFGVDRIRQILVRSCDEHDQPHDTIARIMGAVDDFSQNPNSQSDDQTLVIIRHA